MSDENKTGDEDENSIGSGNESTHSFKNDNEKRDGNKTDASCTDQPYLRESTPRKFNFWLKFKKWKKFGFHTSRRGDRSLAGDWSDVFARHIGEKNPACPMIFKWNHVRRADSRKKNSTFFTAIARCKFEGCLRYSIKIKNEPLEDTPIKVKVKAIKPFVQIQHEEGVKKGRPVKGVDRQKVAVQIKQDGVSNTFYKKLGSTNPVAFEAGNTTGYGSKEVLQKISSESNLSSRLHKDVICEVALLKAVYEKEDESVGQLRGCIQYLSMFPFCVILYSNEQLSMFAEDIRSGKGTMYFDATGKIVSNVPSQPKKVFYYPLLLKGEKGNPPIPVAEMISNSHNTVDISTFFMKLNRDLHQIYPSVGNPQRLEIDFSWAFIHAILLSFNHEDISRYLQRAWDTVHSIRDWGNCTKIHICSAHLLHKISGRLARLITNKDSRRFVMYVIARMIDAKTLEEIDTIFKNLCTLLLSNDLSSDPDIGESLEYLDKIINSENVSYAVDDDEDDVAAGSRPSGSAFGKHFRRILEDVKANIDKMGTLNKTTNPFYSPDTLTYLVNIYLSILPLWSGLLLEGPDNHDTNSPAENWMKIVKHDILGGKARLTPGNFIIEMRANLKGRLREYRSSYDLKYSNAFRKRKNRNNSSFSTSEEKWGGKKAKKGVYFKTPDKVKKRRKTSVIEEKGGDQGTKSLHWGGNLRIENKVVRLSNRCPVDNMLIIVFYALRQAFTRKWFEENRKNIKVCDVFLNICQCFESELWGEGREVWLKEYIPLPTGDSWDIWGSEAERFVQHFSEVQETCLESTCSKRMCPKKEKTFKSREILLGAPRNDQESSSLIESLSDWEESPSPSTCGERTPHGTCSGMRTCSRRRFAGTPPSVLIMSVTYLSQVNGLVPRGLPDVVKVMDNRYQLFGYTLGTGSHFKGYLRLNNAWHRYDGLRTPEISMIKDSDEDGLLEHVIYMQQI